MFISLPVFCFDFVFFVWFILFYLFLLESNHTDPLKVEPCSSDVSNPELEGFCLSESLCSLADTQTHLSSYFVIVVFLHLNLLGKTRDKDAFMAIHSLPPYSVSFLLQYKHLGAADFLLPTSKEQMPRLPCSAAHTVSPVSCFCPLSLLPPDSTWLDEHMCKRTARLFITSLTVPLRAEEDR